MRFCKTLVLFVAIMVLAGTAGATTINFDNLPQGGNTHQAGSTYDGIGVHISTLFTIPKTVDAAGDTFTATRSSDTFWLVSNLGAISNPNYAAATRGGFFDVLFAFNAPITSLSLQVDDTFEGANGDVVRLLARESIGVNHYRVVAVDDALDNAQSFPANFLQVALAQGFSYAIFQTTTEQEGFDNLTFQLAPEQTGAVPEPASLTLLATGLAGVMARARRPSRR